MQVLIVASVDAPVDPDVRPPSSAVELASAWSAAASHCVVDPVALPAAPPPTPPGRAVGQGARPVGVFVPTTALGLSSVEPVEPPEVRLLRDRVRGADLVVVHVPRLDAASLHGGPVAAAADAAGPWAVPVVVLTGRDEVTRRELAAAGVAGAHDVGDPWSTEAVARVARTWAPRWAE